MLAKKTRMLARIGDDGQQSHQTPTLSVELGYVAWLVDMITAFLLEIVYQ